MYSTVDLLAPVHQATKEMMIVNRLVITVVPHALMKLSMKIPGPGQYVSVVVPNRLRLGLIIIRSLTF